MSDKLEQLINWAYVNEMKVLIGILIVIFIVGCTALNQRMRLEDDHAGEELIEQVIEAKTGMDLDLSPNSPEKK